MPKIDKSKGQDSRNKEIRLIELIRENPELYDTGHPFSKDNNQKRLIWEYISEEMNTPVATLKKLWKKMRYNYTKRCRDLESDKKINESKPCDEALTFLMTSVMEYANENNCGNVVAISPGLLSVDEKMLKRSSSNLTSITEEEKSTTTLVPEDEVDSCNFISGGRTNRGMIIERGENSGVKITSDRVLRPRHSEPARLNLRENVRRDVVDVTSVPRRLTLTATTTTTTTTPNTRSKNRKFIIDPKNSTRSFFDSVAITVSSFPQHLQALVKLEVCKIVAKKECELSSTKNHSINDDH